MEDLQKAMERTAYQITGADSHVKSRESRIAHTPIKDVEWSGSRGASRCTPKDPESIRMLSKYNQTYVSYDRTGEPDFRPFADASVKISDMSADRQKNFRSMDQKLLKTSWAKERGLKSEADVRQYRQEHNLTPHECSDGVTMLLVPEFINRRFTHAGGVSEMGALNGEVNIKEDGLLRTVGKVQGEFGIKTRQAAVQARENLNATSEGFWQSMENIDGMQPVLSAAGTVNEYGKEFTVGAAKAVNNAAFPLMVLGVQNLCEVAAGQKTMEEARNEMVHETASVAVRGGGVRIAGKAVSELAEKTGSELLEFVSKNANGVVQVANVAVLVFKSFNKLVNDEISGAEFFDEIGEKGVGLIGDTLGTAVGYGLAEMLIPASIAGGPAGILVGAGAFIGGMIVSTVCVSIYRSAIKLREKYRAMGEAYRHRIAELNCVIDSAVKEMKDQKEQLSSMIKEEYAEWDQQFGIGFQTILDAMLANNLELLSNGLEHILSVFNAGVLFKNMEEFDEFFFDDEAVLTL